MKGLRKLALASAVSAVSTGAVAELQMLDDARMQDVTGQAGLTIDVESEWEIGEFAYQDEGFILLQGIRMGGNSIGNGTGSGGTLLDNLRLEIDVASGQVDPLTYGFSNMRELAQLYVDAGNADPAFGDVAGGTDSTRGGLAIDTEKDYDDGDLVIHFDFTDGWATEGGFEAYSADPALRFENDSYHDVELMFEHAVDYRLEIDAIGLAHSNYNVGDKGLDIDTRDGVNTGQAGTTTLISQLGIQGYLGPEDLHIDNNGNGFGAVDTNTDGYLSDAEIAATSTGRGDANSKITWGTYFRITDLDVYIDIAGVQISDMAIHNTRGDRTGIDGTSSFDFAHSIRQIYAVKNAVFNHTTIGQPTVGDNVEGYVDGIAINTEFKGDIDISHISFGDTGQSIGQIFITDMHSVTNWTVSAH